MKSRNILIKDFYDVENFLGNFVWNTQFCFDINALNIKEAPAHCTQEGKLRYCLRQLFENPNNIKQFLIDNWHFNTSMYFNNNYDWKYRIEDHQSLMACIETCISYLEEYPIMKENLIDRVINSQARKSKFDACEHNDEIDPTWDDFILDCNEQFNSMMDDMDSWCNID